MYVYLVYYSAAVSHEKGKITVLQLSALLKQADSSKRKLTLTRLASAPIPFTVLSITGNQWNEDFLAVCGLKVSGWVMN
jgi:E3 ubiquitin-protein ligase UBR4